MITLPICMALLPVGTSYRSTLLKLLGSSIFISAVVCFLFYRDGVRFRFDTGIQTLTYYVGSDYYESFPLYSCGPGLVNLPIQQNPPDQGQDNNIQRPIEPPSDPYMNNAIQRLRQVRRIHQFQGLNNIQGPNSNQGQNPNQGS